MDNTPRFASSIADASSHASDGDGEATSRARFRARRAVASAINAGRAVLALMVLVLAPCVAHADWPPSSDTRAARGSFAADSVAELGEQPRRPAAREAGTVGVVYPELGEPYRTVFARIIQGIEEAASGPVRGYPIPSGAETADLAAQLKRDGVRAVIALGRQGVKASANLERDIPVVVGGVLAVSEADSRNLTGVSLTPDPGLLFARLKSLLPAIRRVVVVYNPRNNDGLIRLARDAARVQGLELEAIEAQDLASAARQYESIFAGIDGRRDAVWLPQDATTVDEGTILPLILKESWNRNVPVFSSSFLHVRKGALFALYPDNVELGRTLAASAQSAMNGEPRRRGVLPLRDVQIAVNLRTANHIGLNISFQQQRGFDFIFPEP